MIKEHHVQEATDRVDERFERYKQCFQFALSTFFLLGVSREHGDIYIYIYIYMGFHVIHG